jgi:hypothetical protein
VRIATRVAGVAGATALGIATLGATAFADSADNDGTNTGNDLNTITAPIQTCALSAAGGTLGPIPILSPTTNNCVNTPLVDHHTAERN